MSALAADVANLCGSLLSGVRHTGRRQLLAPTLAIGLITGCLAHPAQAAHHSRRLAPVATKHVAVKSARHGGTIHKPVRVVPVSTHQPRSTPTDQAEQITPAVLSALRAAQQKVSADPFVLLAIAWKESRFDPLARNRHSSARGLLQFTTTTWLTVIRDFGARHGLPHLAAAIRTDREGRLSVTSPHVLRAILRLRDDPNLEVIMAAERLAQQRSCLEAFLGRPATAADLYVLHLLGPDGAKEFLGELAQKPDSPSVVAVGHVAQPNLGLFVRNGRTLSIAEAYAGIQATLDEQTARYAALFSKHTA